MNTVSNKSASFLENMLTLKNFFERNDHSAFLFAVCDSYHVRKEVNELLLAYCDGKEKQTGTVELIPNIPEGFLTQLRKVKEQYKSGLILTNIDTLIDHTDGVFAYDLNHMREGLTALKIPILIWLNRQNHTIITQKAIDLYLRRDLSTLFFDDAVNPHKEGMIERFTESTREAADFEETQMRISLLEQQLEETKDDDLHRRRIANEIVLPLIKAYVQNSMLIPAKELLSEYEGDFDYKKGEAYKVIAGLFKETGSLDKAIANYEKAIKINVGLYGEDNNEAANLYSDIGLAWMGKGDLGKAIENMEKALKIGIKLRGEESISVATLYNNLGMGWKDKGDLRKAIDYMEKAIKIGIKLSGEESMSVAILYNNLGVAWQDKGDLEKAIEYLEKALKIDIKLSSEESINVTTRYNNLGIAWQNNGDSEKAIEYFEKALKICIKLSGEENIKVATLYNNLGEAWQDIGDLEKAIEYFEKALKIILSLSGEEEINITTIYNNLGMAWLDKGDLNKAIEYLEKSLKIHLKLSGEESIGVAGHYNNIGMVFIGRSDIEKAIEYLHKAYTITSKLCGEAHPKTIVTKQNLDLCLSERNKQNRNEP